MRVGWMATVLVGLLVRAAAAQEAIALSEVVASWQGNANAGYVELGMLQDGQQHLKDVGVLIFDAPGGEVALRRTFTFTKDVAKGAGGTFILVATAGMAAVVSGVTPDFTLPDGYLQAEGGRVCWATADALDTPIDCVAWGTFSGDLLGFGRPVLRTPENRALVRKAFTGINRQDWETTLQPTPTNVAGQTLTLPTLCGNERIDQGEQCESGQLGGETCAGLGFAKGKLRCTECRYDTTKCTYCGNGELNGKEECDGEELDGRSCTSLGFTGGTLTCTDACAVDTTTCDATFYVPGGGPAKPDCALEWRVQDAAGRPGVSGVAPPKLRCRDGDAGCDTDTASGTCTLSVALCPGRTDARLAKCTARPTTSVQLLAPAATDPSAASLLAALGALGASTTADGTVTYAPALAAGSCTDTVALTLPVGGKLKLKVRTSPDGGPRDGDVVKLSCTD